MAVFKVTPAIDANISHHLSLSPQYKFFSLYLFLALPLPLPLPPPRPIICFSAFLPTQYISFCHLRPSVFHTALSLYSANAVFFFFNNSLSVPTAPCLAALPVFILSVWCSVKRTAVDQCLDTSSTYKSVFHRMFYQTPGVGLCVRVFVRRLRCVVLACVWRYRQQCVGRPPRVIKVWN